MYQSGVWRILHTTRNSMLFYNPTITNIYIFHWEFYYYTKNCVNFQMPIPVNIYTYSKWCNLSAPRVYTELSIQLENYVYTVDNGILWMKIFFFLKNVVCSVIARVKIHYGHLCKVLLLEIIKTFVYYMMYEW